jgi:hypothetical protein
MTESNPPNPEAPHKPADDSEEVYFQGSPKLRGSLSRLLLCWLIGMILIAVPFLARYEGYNMPMLGWLICIALAVIIAIIPIPMTKRVSYRISNYRIDYERGLLSTNIDTLELWHVEDIRFHQSLIDRIMGVGTITIISHDDTTPQLQLHGIPQARPLFETLKQRVIAVKRQRGVLKMDTGT